MRFGLAVEVGWGLVWRGKVCYGEVWQSGLGVVRWVLVRSGVAVMVWYSGDVCMSCGGTALHILLLLGNSMQVIAK